MINKRGGKYSIILSLILGLLVLGFFMSLVYQEYFTNNSSWEVCRESIQLRSTLPEAQFGGINFHSFKTSFPLKCKTSVVDIEKKDIVNGNYKKIIADTIARCWALYDKGDSSAFPPKFYSATSICVPCARIHLTEVAKSYIFEKHIKINIRNSLDERMNGMKYSYLSYLENSGKKFSAFNFAGGRQFNLSGNSFNIDEVNQKNATLHNGLTGETSFSPRTIDLIDYSPLALSMVSLPKVLNSDSGDLLIGYGIAVIPRKLNIGDYVPYLFYFQTGQTKNPFDEVKNQFADGPVLQNVNFCESWDGIPA